jgi:hypothetical protein
VRLRVRPGGVLRTATSSGAAVRFRLHAHGRVGRDDTGTEFSAPDLSLCSDVLELGDGDSVFFRETEEWQTIALAMAHALKAT